MPLIPINMTALNIKIGLTNILSFHEFILPFNRFRNTKSKLRVGAVSSNIFTITETRYLAVGSFHDVLQLSS